MVDRKGGLASRIYIHGFEEQLELFRAKAPIHFRKFEVSPNSNLHKKKYCCFEREDLGRFSIVHQKQRIFFRGLDWKSVCECGRPTCESQVNLGEMVPELETEPYGIHHVRFWFLSILDHTENSN